jgi:ABC-type arginine transport system ATPase subunit
MVKAAAEFARVPLVFAGGNEERVAAARAAFDGANLSSFDKLPQVLAAAVEMARAVASSPVIESRPSVRTAAG